MIIYSFYHEHRKEHLELSILPRHIEVIVPEEDEEA
ncbi:hypothetical protein J2T20_005271 [Paenibacillus wynnii]|nr:hypothetical protein [Paenibacillus wynnii]